MSEQAMELEIIVRGTPRSGKTSFIAGVRAVLETHGAIVKLHPDSQTAVDGDLMPGKGLANLKNAVITLRDEGGRQSTQD